MQHERHALERIERLEDDVHGLAHGGGEHHVAIGAPVLVALDRAIEVLASSSTHAKLINGCGVCVDLHAHGLRKTKEPLERLLSIGAWRDVPYFTPPERAALALAESITRIADSSDPVPDAVWAEAAKHYDEAGLAQLVLLASLANFWNRLNVPTRQVAGAQRW